jgi:sugar phosphate permease
MQVTVVGLLVMGGIVNYLDRSALAIANLSIREELGLSATSMGVLLSAFLLAYAFSQLPIGFLIDKLGPRLLLGSGIAFWSLMQTAGGLVTNFYQFYVARFLLGVGEATQFPTGIRVVNNWFHITKRGLPTGIFNSASFLGTALAPPILTWLMLSYGWRAMFITMGAVGFIASAIWFTFYRDPKGYVSDEDLNYIRSGDAPRVTTPIGIAQWSKLFRHLPVWGMILGCFGTNYLVWMYYSWLPGFLEMQQHISIAKTGIYAAIPPVFGTLGSIFGGYASDWLANHGFSPLNSRKIPICGGLLGSALLTIMTAYVSDNTLVITYISISYFLTGLSTASIWAIVTATAPPDYIASCGSIQLFGGYIGATLSPIITGMVVDATGSFLLALLIGAGMAVFGAFAYGFLVNRPISGMDLESSAGKAAMQAT